MDKTLNTILDSYIRTDLEEKIDVDAFIEALQELVKEAIPEKRPEIKRRIHTLVEADRAEGYNQAIEDITKALRERGLL